MSKPYASNEAVRAAEGKPKEAYGHELNWNGTAILLYDEEEEADRLAAEFGTYVKHSKAKFKNSCWKVFSLVRLPSN
jgi:hypothetical protein